MQPTARIDQRLTELDGVRALSILPVLALHASYGQAFGGGFLGVDMFFVLSGYIITRLLLLERQATGQVDLGAFYLRRVFRILPPLLLCLAIALPLRDDAAGDRMFVTVAVLGFFANFVPAGTLGNLGPLWSLAIEEQFYLVWPLVFAIAQARAPRLAIGFALGVIVAAMAVRSGLAAAGWAPKTLYAFTFARMDSIMIGCTLALIEPKLGRPPARVVEGIGYASVAAVLACLWLAERNAMSTSAWAFPAFELVVAAMLFALPRLPAGSPLRLAFTNRAAVYIGQRSYGIYLYHYPIFKAFEALRVPGSAANFLMVATAAMAVTLIVAELSWRYVEQPALAAKRRFAARRRGVAAG